MYFIKFSSVRNSLRRRVMNDKLNNLFNEGMDTLEYGAKEDYPFGSSESTHWREMGRATLTVAHYLSYIEEHDEDVINHIFDVLGAKYKEAK
jgi:hypothetical protein